jgi:hypothetical protein
MVVSVVRSYPELSPSLVTMAESVKRQVGRADGGFEPGADGEHTEGQIYATGSWARLARCAASTANATYMMGR